MIDVVSTPHFFDGEIELIERLFEDGMALLHIRKKGVNKEDLKRYLKSMNTAFMDSIVLHNQPELALEFGIEKQHISDANLIHAQMFSTSCHSIEELESLENVSQAFLSPVFDSISKCGYAGKKWNVSGVSNNVVKVALGGVSRNNIHEAFDLGFDKVAVLGGIWMSKDPVKSYNELKNEIQ